MLDACPSVELLSTIMPLVPPATSVVFVATLAGAVPEATNSEFGKRKAYISVGS